MRISTKRAFAFFSGFSASLGLVLSCSVTDGAPAAPEALNARTCSADIECGPGRFCGPEGTCSIQCLTAKDCVSALADPSGPNDLTCSLCGRCVAAGVRDSRCLSAVDQPCSGDVECRSLLGEAYTCGPGNLCARTCSPDAADEGCRDVGRGWGCGTAGLCVRKCFRDSDCWYHGWSYACALPPGTDAKANEEAANPVYGACEKRGTPFAPAGSKDPPSARYQGAWGFLAVSAVRVDGVPIVTRLNSVNVQHMLGKITWEGADLAITLKWCKNQVDNFREDDGPVLELFKVLLPDRNVDAISVNTIRVSGVPALAPGAAFDTTAMLDLRGVRGLKNPATDPLPSYKDLALQWDQDRDGNPGMTANVTGALTGDLYQAQRWNAVFHARVVSDDRFHGLVTGESAATVLGATKADLINDAVTSTHPEADRSYFRALRLGEDASCEDVIRLSTTAGSFLEFTPHFDGKRPEPE